MKNQIKILFIFIALLLPQIIYSQFYFFGRNKVQYNEFDWKILKTEHFDIYYYNDFGEMAEIGAFYAEEAYSDLKIKFNNVVTRRIPLIFYNTHLHFQETNTTAGFIPEGVGGFFEFLKGRVVIPYLGSLEGFRHVIRHELVHVFMTNKIYRVLKDRRIPTDKMPPLWFIEGLAEFWSTEWDTQAEMVMRDAVINNYFVSIKNIYAIFGTFLMYKEGQSFLEFVAESYGEEKVYLLLENFWRFKYFNKVIEFVLGKSIEEIDREWLYFLKQKYYPLLADQAPPSIKGKIITEKGFHFSPSHIKIKNKNYIFYIANVDGYSSIYKIKLSEKTKKEKPELIVQGEKEEVFEAFHLLNASLSVNEKGVLAFITKSGATDKLHFYSTDENKLIYSFANEEVINIISPKWIKGTDQILFSAIDNKGFSDLFVYDFNNKKLTRLTNDYYTDVDPAFVTDSLIVFASNRTSGKFKQKTNLFVFNMKDKSISYLTYADANFHTPVYSEIDEKLYFVSDISGSRNLWYLKYDSSKFDSKMYQSTYFLTGIFDYTLVDTNKIVAAAFEKFSFQLNEINLSQLKDSIQNSYVFDFKGIENKWFADKLNLRGEKGKIEFENKYSMDYAQSQVSTDPIFGTRGGAILSLSDILGNDKYFFTIYNTAEVQSDLLKSFNVALAKVNLGNRTNYSYGIFNFSGRRYDIRDSDEYFYERSFGSYLTLFYPLSKFKRIEVNASIVNSDKQVISNVIERKALLLSNTISYVADNSIWGPTGPIDGIRARLLFGYTSDVKFGNVNYFTIIGDYRQYLRFTLRSGLAFRSAVFYNEGKEARRYFMGGSWDLRGWRRWSIRGEKLWLTSLEYRFPLIDLIYLKFPVLDLGFPYIRGALFFDAGGAWDKDYKETLGSVGMGFRFNLFNAITLRYDIGKKIENNFTQFQPRLFYQFFFGWDF